MRLSVPGFKISTDQFQGEKSVLEGVNSGIRGLSGSESGMGPMSQGRQRWVSRDGRGPRHVPGGPFLSGLGRPCWSWWQWHWASG